MLNLLPINISSSFVDIRWSHTWPTTQSAETNPPESVNTSRRNSVRANYEASKPVAVIERQILERGRRYGDHYRRCTPARLAIIGAGTQRYW